jgi:hypothetical protein
MIDRPRNGYAFRDIGEANITSINMAENKIVIEIEKRGRVIADLQNRVSITYTDIPDVWLDFRFKGVQVVEEWHGSEQSTITITIDLASTDIAVFEGEIDYLNHVQIHETLYINEKAELSVDFLYRNFAMAEIIADVIFEENEVRVLGQKTYKPAKPFESFEEYEQWRYNGGN